MSNPTGGAGIPTVVTGHSGRMSRLLAAAVRDDPGLQLSARLALRRGTEPPEGTVAALSAVPAPAPVVVDFTSREGTAALLEQALTNPCALVIGTSGLRDADLEWVHQVGTVRAVVRAANFSLCLSRVTRLVQGLATDAGPDWRAGVVDIHFVGKRDTPSATATALADAWAGGHQADRPPVASFRIGGGVSEHRFLAAGPDEQLEIIHRVGDRAAFLPGVRQAVRFAHRAPAGVYSLDDVFGEAA